MLPYLKNSHLIYSISSSVSFVPVSLFCYFQVTEITTEIPYVEKGLMKLILIRYIHYVLRILTWVLFYFLLTNTNTLIKFNISILMVMQSENLPTQLGIFSSLFGLFCSKYLIIFSQFTLF